LHTVLEQRLGLKPAPPVSRVDLELTP